MSGRNAADVIRQVGQSGLGRLFLSSIDSVFLHILDPVPRPRRSPWSFCITRDLVPSAIQELSHACMHVQCRCGVVPREGRRNEKFNPWTCLNRSGPMGSVQLELFFSSLLYPPTGPINSGNAYRVSPSAFFGPCG